MRIKKTLTTARTFLGERVLPCLGIPAPEGSKCVRALRSWIDHLKAEPLRPLGPGRCLILASGSKHWVEWAAFAACHLRLRGVAADIIFDPAEIRRLYPQARPRDNFWLGVGAIPDVRLFPVVTVPADPSYHAAIRAYAPAALSYELRVEERDIVDSPVRYRGELDALIARMDHRVAFLSSHLKSSGPYVSAVCYSGLIAETRIYQEVFRSAGLTAYFVEGWGWRPGNLVFNQDGPALDYAVKRWWAKRGPWTASHAAAIDEYMGFMNVGTRSGGFAGMVRIQNSDIAFLPGRIRDFLSDGKPYMVVAPNVIGDTSTVRRETIFPSIKRWIRELIAWARDNPDVKLVIRAHPAEVWMGDKCTTRIAGYIATECGDLPANVLVVGSDEKVNTFAISQRACAALVWMSTAGADFVLRRIPCIAAAKGGYSGLGVLREPGSPREYFGMLRDAASGRLDVGDASVQAAREYMHLLHFVLPYPVSGRGFRAYGMDIAEVRANPKASEFFDIISGQVRSPLDQDGRAGASR